MADGKAQVEQTIQIGKEIIEKLGEMTDADQAKVADIKKRMNDIVYALEGIQNKIFFKTKNSLSFTMPTLSSAERVQEAIEDGNMEALLNELDSLESNVDILKVKVASQDIIIT